MTTKSDIGGDIKRLLSDSGFSAIGFAPPQLSDRDRSRLGEFIAQGEHGTMAWMARHLARRQNPLRLMPHAKTIIMVGLNYAPATDPMEHLQMRTIGNISVYARNQDYHDVMKKRLRACASAIATDHNCDVKIFVDTAPLAEKPLASKAGIGWQGKHSNLVSRQWGSWLFLGAIVTDLQIPFDAPHRDLCGDCRRCLDICPTNAFPAPYKLDARRCISYLTIEHAGAIPTEFRRAIGNRIYGCDDCLAVCPWNKFASASQTAAFHARDELNNPPLRDLLLLDDYGFRQLFRKSPIKRIGYERFMRNLLIAAGNSRDKKLLPMVQRHRKSESAVLAESALWAEEELLNNVGNSS